MKFLEAYVMKRALFMLAVMAPVLMILEFMGKSSVATTSLLAGVTAGVSVVLFPSPEHLEKLKKLDQEKNGKSGK